VTTGFLLEAGRSDAEAAAITGQSRTMACSRPQPDAPAPPRFDEEERLARAAGGCITDRYGRFDEIDAGVVAAAPARASLPRALRVNSRTSFDLDLIHWNDDGFAAKQDEEVTGTRLLTWPRRGVG
jgi:hypothetical protein